MRMGTAAGQEAELRRLREDLYRPSPRPDAVERYTALLAERGTAPAEATPEPAAPERSRGVRRRRRLVPLAAAGAVLATALLAAALVRPAERAAGAAEPLVAGGPYAVSDQEVLGSLSDRGSVDPRLLVRAVRGSDLAQLDVWDVREAGAWSQQGLGPMSRRFAGQRVPAGGARPFSIVVQCPAPARYRWTIIGTTPDRPAVHVLATAGAACGPVPTVATSTRAAGSTATGFDLTVPTEVRWGMAFVYQSSTPDP